MPMPRRGPRSQSFEKPENVKKTLARILKYMFAYKIQLVFIAIGIIGSSLSGVAGTYMIKPVVNDYIIPAIGRKNPDLSGSYQRFSYCGNICFRHYLRVPLQPAYAECFHGSFDKDQDGYVHAYAEFAHKVF